ncbi:Hypp6976 [Branchiostoma lanceolatum]|uniref:Hypp6976 protein n=1 Tax=Branchiostoma lanceolatum TaxID=7740 RepID=A0A8J9YVX9_BRALA|nr:Hypp6976 [Branchiostoma lanceolatum]
MQDIANLPWTLVELFEDVDDALDVFMLLFSTVVDFHAPVRRFTVRANSVPWLDAELREAMAMRDEAKTEADKYGLHSDREVYKKLRNYVV